MSNINECEDCGSAVDLTFKVCDTPNTIHFECGSKIIYIDGNESIFYPSEECLEFTGKSRLEIFPNFEQEALCTG